VREEPLEITEILKEFDKTSREKVKSSTVSFHDYLEMIRREPEKQLRDIFRIVYDMIHSHVGEGYDEYPDDPESVHFIRYDFTSLFIRDCDNPFFADRLFANRFMNLINSFNQLPDWHKIYFLEGPPGSGKSTFLNNFLSKLERYMAGDEGESYETAWTIDRRRFVDPESFLLKLSGQTSGEKKEDKKDEEGSPRRYLEVHCPNHDHPVLQIPSAYRRELLYDIIKEDDFRQELFQQKKYEWIFKNEPCTICSSLYEALLERLGSPLEVLSMVTPKRMRYNRRLGEGLSVFNPGDRLKVKPETNPLIQEQLDSLFGDSAKVHYLHSELARTNNGIYVVMDIKNFNKDRLLNLHGIISDGIHKVENLEETIRSLFLGLINPQDKEFIENTKSLNDRSLYIKMPYILDYSTEVQIFRNRRSENLDECFFPLVLENFARLIVASRLARKSEGINQWIGSATRYRKICDKELLILKMELYSGKIPQWLGEEDRRKFTSAMRKKIIGEAEEEGVNGFTGRESIYLFNEFMAGQWKNENPITMDMVYRFFSEEKKELLERLPDDFIVSLVRFYDYSVLQQMKICIYSYSKSKISQNVLDYIFGVNFDIGAREKNKYTGKMLEISEESLRSVEDYLIGSSVSDDVRSRYRDEVLQKYISVTTSEMTIEKKDIRETELYRELEEKYIHNLKNNALDPFAGNEALRSAIKEFGTADFRAHDKKIKRDTTYLLKSLQRKFGYTQESAQEICIYILDKGLIEEFKETGPF